MPLRWILFRWLALGIGLILPTALFTQYRWDEQASRAALHRQFAFVAELLEEKVAEPLDDIEKEAKLHNKPGHWQDVELNIGTNQAVTWLYDDGRQVKISLKELVAMLDEVPYQGSGYAFLLDNQGTIVARLSDGALVPGHLTNAAANRVVVAAGSDRALLNLPDPIYDDPGDIVLLSIPRLKLSVGMTFPERDFQERMRPLARATVLMAGILLAVAWAICFFGSRRLTAPLERLTSAVQRLLKGELEVELLRSHVSEVEQLRLAFMSMRDNLAAHLEKIQRASSESARMQRELELARNIQGNADIRLRSGAWIVYGKSEPARDVGGDFMDAFLLPDGRLALLIGDVSGKGIAAALHTLLARSALKLGLTSTGSPAGALKQANALLCLDNHDSVFVTALVAVFDPQHRQLVWARAGHPTPLTPSGSLVGPNAPPLGLLEVANFQECTTEIQEGMLLLYTDGLSEAEDEDGAFMPLESVQRALSIAPQSVWDVLHQHRGKADPSDDATTLVLQRVSDSDEALIACENKA